MKLIRVTLILLTLFSVGCKPKKAEQFKALPFPQVAVPDMISDSQDRAEYVVMHWWDSFTDPNRSYPCDSSFVSGVVNEEVERNMANWVNMMNMLDYSISRKAVVRLYDRGAACEVKDSSSNVFESLSTLVEKYLYDPNSPFRNEDIYGAYAEKMASSELVDDVMRGKFEREARLSALNRVGTKAADFRFCDINGRYYSLYEIDAELTLLFFSNPGCTACKDIIDVLSNEPVISGLIKNGTMAVLNIYIDEDIQSWMSYMPIYPETWYNGFDPDMLIRGDNIYYVRAIPSLYLLNKDKIVIMKDASESRVFEWLSRYPTCLN